VPARIIRPIAAAVPRVTLLGRRPRHLYAPTDDVTPSPRHP
jgi:hypothetical protein